MENIKKLLTQSALASIILLLGACGPTEAEKKAEQDRNEALVNEKVNQIMQKLEALPNSSGTDQDSVAIDSSSSE